MPKVGLGTYQISETEPIVKAILEAGYRHLDTAYKYENEEIVGAAVKQAIERSEGKVKREDIFVVTKLWHNQYENPEQAIKESLAKLGLEYVDLYLIHWPASFFTEGKKPLHRLWAELEALVDKGLVKSIGVSNFNVQLLCDLLCYARIKPVCNQVELHPYCVQDGLVSFMKEQNIVPVAYCPIGRPTPQDGSSTDGKGSEKIPDIRQDNGAQAIAEKHGRSVLQIVLKWGLQRGHGIIPKSCDVVHQRQNNTDLAQFELSEEDMKYISSLDLHSSRICNFFQSFNNVDMFA